MAGYENELGQDDHEETAADPLGPGRGGDRGSTDPQVESDVDAILHAWHGQHVDSHLRELAQIRDASGDPGDRLVAVLTRYAHIVRQRQSHSHDAELVKFLHPDHQVADAHGQLHDMIQQLITAAAKVGRLRDDVDPAELAGYCLHALSGAAALTSDAAVNRLVTITLDGLRPTR